MAIHPAHIPPSPANISHSFHGNGCRTIDNMPAVKQAIKSAFVFNIGITIAIKVNYTANVKDHSSDIKDAPKTPNIVAICQPNHRVIPLPKK